MHPYNMNFDEGNDMVYETEAQASAGRPMPPIGQRPLNSGSQSRGGGHDHRRPWRNRRPWRIPGSAGGPPVFPPPGAPRSPIGQMPPLIPPTHLPDHPHIGHLPGGAPSDGAPALFDPTLILSLLMFKMLK